MTHADNFWPVELTLTTNNELRATYCYSDCVCITSACAWRLSSRCCASVSRCWVVLSCWTAARRSASSRRPSARSSHTIRASSTPPSPTPADCTTSEPAPRLLHQHQLTAHSCRTAFSAQHLRPSGVLGCWPQWPGTHSRILSVIHRAAQTVLGVYLKRTCSRVTGASSALGDLNDMRYTNPRTHSLTQPGASEQGEQGQRLLPQLLRRGSSAPAVLRKFVDVTD